MKIYNPRDIENVKLDIEKQNADTNSIASEIPFYFDLKLTGGSVLKMEIPQFTYQEYQNLFFYHNYISKIMSEIDNSIININDFNQIRMLNFYLARIITCKNPEIFIDKHIIKINSTNYIENITKKDLYILFKEIIRIYKNYEIVELDYFKKYRFNSTFANFFKFKFYEYKRLKNSSIEYLNNLAKIIIDYYISNILSKVNIDDLIEIFNKVLLYNTYIKKKMSNTKEEISNRMAVSTKRTHTLENFSKITIGKNFLTYE